MLDVARHVAWIVAVLGLVGCGAAVPPVPGKGGPAWIELTSEHFTVWTDAEPARVRELVREMEHLRQVVVGVAFPSVPAGGRTLVIALRGDDELRAFSRTDQPRPYAVPAWSPLWQPMIVLPAFSNRDPGELTLPHELTHVISFAVIHHQPRWLSEGMADFFQTVRLDPGAATADVGIAPERFGGKKMRLPHLIPIEKLFAWRNPGADESREYSTAWALFTFLINAHRSELLQYLQLLQRVGKPRDEVSVQEAAQLWSEAFPSLPLVELDVELRQWLLTGRHIVMHFKVQRHEWPIAERPLSDADAYAIHGMLRLFANKKAAARADLAAALAAERTNVLARLGAAVLDDKMTLPEARALVAAHPGDWRAWWLAAQVIAAAQGDERDEHELQAMRAKACELIAHNPALIAPGTLCANDESAASSP